MALFCTVRPHVCPAASRPGAGPNAMLSPLPHAAPRLGTALRRSRGAAVRAPVARTSTGAAASTFDARLASPVLFGRGGPPSAAVVVRRFYGHVNARDAEAAVALLADDVVYEDKIYARPFTGRDEVKAHLTKVFSAIPSDFTFVIDDCTADNGAAVGLTWHVEVGGSRLPFGGGCSFYRVDSRGRICYACDVPEPAPLKPGDATLNALGFISALARVLPTGRATPPRAGMPQRGGQPVAPQPPTLPGAVPQLLWAVFGLYTYALVLSPDLPGDPVWRMQASTLQSVQDASLDFFFITPLLNYFAGLDAVPAPVVHPVDLGLFNFVNAWSLMWLGLLATDTRATNAQRNRLVASWTGQMFLTNLFLLPWVAQRASGSDDNGSDDAAQLPAGPLADLAQSPVLGVIGGSVGLISILWALFATPPGFEVGDRFAHFMDSISTDRLQLAFVVDCVVYAVAQWWFITDEHDIMSAWPQQQAQRRGADAGDGPTSFLVPPKWLAAVPFAGMAAWLALRPQQRVKQLMQRK